VADELTGQPVYSSPIEFHIGSVNPANLAADINVVVAHEPAEYVFLAGVDQLFG
jgi:hypothetical protein